VCECVRAHVHGGGVCVNIYIHTYIYRLVLPYMLIDIMSDANQGAKIFVQAAVVNHLFVQSNKKVCHAST